MLLQQAAPLTLLHAPLHSQILLQPQRHPGFSQILHVAPALKPLHPASLFFSIPPRAHSLPACRILLNCYLLKRPSLAPCHCLDLYSALFCNYSFYHSLALHQCYLFPLACQFPGVGSCWSCSLDPNPSSVWLLLEKFIDDGMYFHKGPSSEWRQL